MLPSSLLRHSMFSIALAGLAASGCASSSAVTRTASSAELTVAQAETIVARYRDRREQAATSPDPLNQPKNLDDVVEVLRRDEISLFPNAVKFATNEGSARGKALAAQLLIAWGDAQNLLGTLLDRAAHDLEERRTDLEKKDAIGKLDADGRTALKRISGTLQDLEGVERALHRVGARHLAEGMAMAQQVIASNPNDYEGYRVAADYFHQTEDWAKFEEMAKKIEALNPSSNGLVFLRAEAARDRDNDHGEASKLLNEALKRDPKFVRAQVALLVLQRDMNGAWTEMRKLTAMNPKHQMVQWMGPVVKSAYDEWAEVQRRRTASNFNRALPGADK